ncbi:UNVERIFIED_CONTAM: 60S acidic ribosomal protein P2 [Sesamum angustifolium]|uniref:60S acidic ribosomal protein P2 n=1 Tax=Sesamum angustifolium TaxID=2727405 RepID=A0AAW2J4E8_9LAMI
MRAGLAQLASLVLRIEMFPQWVSRIYNCVLQLVLFLQIGAEADDDRIELLLSQVKGKDITKLIAAGREKLASVPAGSGAVAVAAPDTKKEEKVEEKEESDDLSFHYAAMHICPIPRNY